jgi:1-deoxy-D-xylulose-5-phosphate synthase
VLSRIEGPADLRRLPAEQLPQLAAEIRSVLVDTVSRTGGHLGPNLGVVELTMALHRVFQTPRDALVFDTGHQSYVHKLLTGRRDQFHRLRAPGGLSGYPSRHESPHDVVENSHASTALSYADGLAKGFALTHDADDRVVVAVIGDGALTGGMAWEALNNLAGPPRRPVIIVLNDNGRSYAPTVGALAHALATDPGPLFRSLGLLYLGPVDGHDTAAVESVLRHARSLRAPVLVHCRTVKGRGHLPAELDELDHQHTVAPASASAGSGCDAVSWTHVFSEELVAVAAEQPRVVATTAAMLHPTGLGDFARKFPDRVFDVGIAEAHALTSAAGMALAGLHPVVCLYATFLNRAFDQALLDVALHRLPVTLVLDRAGITGPDGPSHHGMWDMGLLGMIPGFRVAAPRDEPRLRTLLREAIQDPGPTAIRFPKGTLPPPLPPLGGLGGGEVLRDGDDVLIIAVGPTAHTAVAAADRLAQLGVRARVIDPRWVVPLDPLLVAQTGRYRRVVTIEDGAEAGGVGDALARATRHAGLEVSIRSVALPQRFLPHGSRANLLAAAGLDMAGIVAAATD